jgi:tol-pal system protein YbgF
MVSKRLLILTIMAGMLGAPAMSHAQSNDIMNRLDRMENEIQTLGRALYRGEPVPIPQQSPVINTQNNHLLDRLQRLESDLRSLTGRVEKQTFEIGQLRQQLEAMTYQMRQDQMSETTPVVIQPEENLRPDETAAAIAEPPPQPESMGMKTATPTLPQGNDPTALYEVAYSKIQSGAFAEAEALFQQFIEDYPDHKLAANSYYWLGETYYVRGDYERATRTFAQSYQKYPKGPKGPDNLLKLGLSLTAEGKSKDACVAFSQLSKEYPAAAPEIMKTADTERAKLGC